MPLAPDDVLAVAVLYGAAPTAAPAVRSLGAALGRSGARADLLLYDNSPRPAPEPERRPEGWRPRYVHDPSNPGVGAAYNAGGRLARELGKRWLLLLDQDTTFPPSAPGAYADAVGRYPGCELFAPVLAAGPSVYSPCRVVGGRGRPAPAAALRPGLHPLGDLHVLNSGLMVAVDLFERAGGYDPGIRLDFSDFAFLHKAARHTDRFALVDVRCRHDLSAGEPDVARARWRFGVYCDGAARYAALTGDRRARALPLVRSLKLSARYRDPSFVVRALRGLPS